MGVRDRPEVTLISGLGRSWGADWLCHYRCGVYTLSRDPETGLMQGSLLFLDCAQHPLEARNRNCWLLRWVTGACVFKDGGPTGRHRGWWMPLLCVLDAWRGGVDLPEATPAALVASAVSPTLVRRAMQFCVPTRGAQSGILTRRHHTTHNRGPRPPSLTRLPRS